MDKKKASEILGRSGLQLPRLPSLNTDREKILTEKNLAGYRRAQEASPLGAAFSPATPRRDEPNRTASGRAAAGRLAAPLLTIRALQSTASQSAHPESGAGGYAVQITVLMATWWLHDLKNKKASLG